MGRVVFDMSKIQIQKQITTQMALLTKFHQLYLICQRYKFKSKLQRLKIPTEHVTVVFDMSKIQIQKQITTYQLCKLPIVGCI